MPVRRWLFALAGIQLSGCANIPQQPAPPLDLLTVSGRHGLPYAEKYLGGRLALDGVDIADDDAAMLGSAKEQVTANLQAAIERSLRNYGYASEAAENDKIHLSARVVNLAARDEDAGVVVSATLEFDSGSALANCLPHEASAEFTSLSRTAVADDRRAGALIGVVALSVLAGATASPVQAAQAGSQAGTWGAQQMTMAANADAAANTTRPIAHGQAVAPTNRRDDAVRQGATYAIQLAIADFIRHLDGGSACMLTD